MIVVITGPTGVGKTKLSISLAKKYNGIILNADATQMYKELNIGSAKIKEEEMMGIKHYLLDYLDVLSDYSVSDYQKDGRILLDKFSDKNIFIVGGTGLYIKALLYDYKFNKIDKKDYSKYSNEELLKMCLEIDKNCQIHVNNRIRLENFLNREGSSNTGNKLLYDAIFIGLTTDRVVLYEKINKRVDEMFQEGLVREVDNLLNKYPNANILKRAIGYKEVISYLEGNISLEDARWLIKKNSRHYAKRQYTWFNNQMQIKWFKTDYNNFNNTIKEVEDYLDYINF